MNCSQEVLHVVGAPGSPLWLIVLSEEWGEGREVVIWHGLAELMEFPSQRFPERMLDEV